MSLDKKMLNLAASFAINPDSRGHDKRCFFLGAVGMRRDGVIVMSRNLASIDIEPAAHAEARLSRKLNRGSRVWVARVSKKDGGWAMSRPCPGCEAKLRFAGVTKIVYTIAPDEWGVISVSDQGG